MCRSWRWPIADARAQITARQLLTHRSGFYGDRFDDQGSGDDALEKAVRAFGDLPQSPGLDELYTYCNAGIDLVGRAIENLLGQTFESAMRERVLDRLGLGALDLFRQRSDSPFGGSGPSGRRRRRADGGRSLADSAAIECRGRGHIQCGGADPVCGHAFARWCNRRASSDLGSERAGDAHAAGRGRLRAQARTCLGGPHRRRSDAGGARRRDQRVHGALDSDSGKAVRHRGADQWRVRFDAAQCRYEESHRAAIRRCVAVAGASLAFLRSATALCRDLRAPTRTMRPSRSRTTGCI